MSYKPSDLYVKEVCTSSPTTGAAANADSLPTATANRNGTDDGAFTLTVTNIDAGRYKVTGTIPGGYASGDVLNVSFAATVGGVAGKAIVDTQVLDGKRISNLADAAALTDYQQRGVAVTLPANPPGGFLVTASFSTAPGWYSSPSTPPTATAIRQEMDANSTRLAHLDADITSRMATFSYTAPDNADVVTALADVAAVQASVGSGLGALALAIKAKTDNLPASPAAVGSQVVLASAGLDLVVAEAGINARQALALVLSAAAGKASGLDANAPVFKGANNTTTRISATTDASGNRTAVTLTPPS